MKHGTQQTIESDVESRHEIRRFEAAKAAMQGLLADPTDHEELRLYRVLDGETPGERIKEFTETCAQAVARIAVAHADALLEELEKKP